MEHILDIKLPQSHKGQIRKPIKYIIKDNCWECTSHSYRKGYPGIRINNVTTSIYRAVYIYLKNGNPTIEVVRHTCDNPKCINPDHLIGGTHSENIQEAYNRGLNSSGCDKSTSKLTKDQVISIFLDTTHTQVELGRIYNISQGPISDIKLRKTYKHETKHLI